jgi:hypothetical protein
VHSLRRLYHRVWGHRQPVDRIALVVLTAVVLGGAFIVLSAEDDDSDQPRPDAVEQAAVDEARSCSEVDLSGRLTERVTCRSKTATLTIAEQAMPVLLEGTQARVYRAEVRDGRLVVRMRIRNETGDPQSVGSASRQFYLSAGGERVYPRAIAPSSKLDPATAATINVQFPLDPRVRRQLAGGRSIDLGVLPFGEADNDQPDRVGVVRLRVTGV